MWDPQHLTHLRLPRPDDSINFTVLLLLLSLLLLALKPSVGPWPLFCIFILYTAGMNPWTGDQPFERPIYRPTERE
jgi:hypothetical protein